jgi:uncharacterized membrane protein YhaH (DUF805 family)
MDATRLGTLWFGFTERVDRRAYAASGFALMAFKYATDALIAWAAQGTLWTPRDYLSPLFSTRIQLVGQSNVDVLAILFVWTLPFVWVGASMTFRRALDAGLSAWSGLLFFVPVVNYLWMLLLCLLPSREPRAISGAQPAVRATSRALFGAAAPAATLGVAAMFLSVLMFGSYLARLFVGTPFAVGFVAGFQVQRNSNAGVASAVVAGQLALLLAAGALLIFGLEGVVCLAMAYPLAAGLAALGAILGCEVVRTHRLRPSHAIVLLLALPTLMGVESAEPRAPERVVVSSIEIAAPPDAVWPHVVGFSELPPPHEVVFALGIAYPIRARIDGEGVGAIRRCEFSTGPFVEPITAWEPPRRLAFDVISQPEPMHETSPYRHIDAPHLLNGLHSRRGEFRLIALPGGRTHLEGRTWYSVEMAPQAYWGLFSDALIHAIHQRVLLHVKVLSEAAGDPS